jgi:ketosteroid isomerase-like protein
MPFQPFLTPEDAQSAFYEAIERGNLEDMMGVWAEDEEIICVHPQGPRLQGFDAVRDSWKRIFTGGLQLKVSVTEQQRYHHLMLAIFVVHENIKVVSGQPQEALVVATNVFMQTHQGWRMVVHHSSASPKRAFEEEIPSVLH